jgi:hypothetical protein
MNASRTVAAALSSGHDEPLLSSNDDPEGSLFAQEPGGL